MTADKKELSKNLLEVLKRCMFFNMGKVVFSLIMITMLSTFIQGLFLISARSGNPILLVVGFIFFTSCIIALYYGYSVMLLRMVRKQFVTIGFLFIGLKRFKTLWTVFVRFVLLLLGVVAALSAVMYLCKPVLDFVLFLEQKMGLMDFISLAYVFILLVICAVFFHFCFVFFLLADNPEDKKDVFKRSLALLKNRKLFFISMCLKAGGKQIITVAVIWLITHLYSFSHKNFLPEFVISLLSFLYVISLFAAEAKITMMIAILFQQFNNKDSFPYVEVLGIEEDKNSL